MSSLSDELARATASGGDEYHLSHNRANILRVLRLSENLRVLEVGGESGALSRHLAENSGGLDVLVSDETSAEAARERLRGLDHATVIHGEVRDLVLGLAAQTYDVIVATEPRGGYLLNAHNPDELRELLRALASALAPGGTLVVTASNPLGVRYLAGGVSPTHHQPFDAISESDAPTLWSRSEFVAHLSHLGLDSRVFGVFPDHHFAQCLISDEAYEHMPSVARDVPNFPSPRRPGDLAGPDERFLWHRAYRGGFARELANSYLYVASRAGSGERVDPALLAAHFPTGRLPRWETMVTFHRGAQGAVCHRSLVSDPDAREAHLTNDVAWRATTEPVYEGAILSSVALASPDVAEALRPWLEHLNNAPQGSLDAQPWNLMLTGGSLQFFDQEWHDDSATTEDIALRGLLYMAIRYRAVASERETHDSRTLADVLRSWAGALGVEANDVAISRMLEREATLIAALSTSTREEVEQILRGHLDARLDETGPPRADVELALLREHVARHTSHLPTMEASHAQFQAVARAQRESMRRDGAGLLSLARHRLRWSALGGSIAALRRRVRPQRSAPV